MKNQVGKSAVMAPYLWWKVDESELAKQITEYQTLDWKKSARKISGLFLVLSTIITGLFVYFGKWDASSLIDAGLMALLSVFCFMGKRWALMAAMIYWTFAKIALIATSLGLPIIQILWWALYMKQFYLAWKVEQIRRKPLPENSDVTRKVI